MKLLIVEDETELRRMMAETLREAGDAAGGGVCRGDRKDVCGGGGEAASV